jgi:hypothetical protein
MKIEDRKFPVYYNTSWQVLFRYIKKYGVNEGYSRLLKEYSIDSNSFSGYLQMISGYINDYDIIQKSSLNPDFYNFINFDELENEEKKIICILAASMDLRVNKPIFELIYENICNSENIEGRYKEVIAKYILKFNITKNYRYILENIFFEIFDECIVYKNLDDNKIVIFTPYSRDVEKIKAIEYIERYFLNEKEKIRVFWKKHFNFIGNKAVSCTDKTVVF